MTDTGTKHYGTDAEMTYIKKKNIDEAIHKKLRKRDEYDTNMQKIYNIVVDHTNEQLQYKAASDATFQAVKAN